MQSFLHHNKGYTKDAFTYIDWKSIEAATKTLTLSCRLWLTKFVSGFSPTAQKMHERGKWEFPLWPLCNAIPENTKHIITCSDHHAKKYGNLLQLFINFLHKINTHTAIIYIFHDTLIHQCHTSFTNNSIKLQSDYDITVAASQQDEIQWHNFIKGHISKHWKTVQSRHFQQIFSTPPSTDSWLKQVIIHICNLSFQMWDHQNSIVHECSEEFLNHKESKN